MTNLEPHKIFAVSCEMETAEKLILNGIRDLQNKYGNEDLFIPFLLISQGIERFLKIAIYSVNGDVVFGHNIEVLNEKFIRLINETDSRTLIAEDRSFLKSDTILNSILEILSHFSDARNGGRYNNLNILEGKDSSDTYSKLSNVVYKIIKADNVLSVKLIDIHKDDNYSYINESIVKLLVSNIEKYISAISRQFTMCNIGNYNGYNFASFFMSKLLFLDKNEGGVIYEQEYFR